MLFGHEDLVHELIRLIVAEADPEKRGVLSEKLGQLLKQESKTLPDKGFFRSMRR
jgi:hypothetical protein